MKPLIGILTNILITENNPERIYVNRDYVKSILRAGGVPLLLPIISDPEVICAQIAQVDALLLSGGQDVHPRYYQEDVTPWLGEVCEDRDRYEMEAIREAIRLQLPLLGVCRGLQLMNVVYGGSLIQDIPQALPASSVEHRQKQKREEGTHEIDILSPSRLYDIMGEKVVRTNSFHHQAVKDLAPGFKVSAYSKDGVVEGIEKEGDHFVVGVQWHPEMMALRDPGMQRLFDAFVQEAYRE